MSAEVIAPTTATFAAGNDVLGIGTTLPTELASWHPYAASPTYVPKSALVFYNSDWSASLTTGQVKFWFITMVNSPTTHEGDLIIGCGWVANAHVSTTAVIRPVTLAGVLASGQQVSTVFNRNSTVMWQLADDDSNGDGEATLFNAAIEPTVALFSNVGRAGEVVGTIQTLDQSGNVISQI